MNKNQVLKKKLAKRSKKRVKFEEYLVFLDNIKINDVNAVRKMLTRTQIHFDLNLINDSGIWLFQIHLPYFLGSYRNV
jgi:hypothetical protein